jgi:hypothetical protein
MVFLEQGMPVSGGISGGEYRRKRAQKKLFA